MRWSAELEFGEEGRAYLLTKQSCLVALRGLPADGLDPQVWFSQLVSVA